VQHIQGKHTLSCLMYEQNKGQHREAVLLYVTMSHRLNCIVAMLDQHTCVLCRVS
jgi:hypothetical protein